MPTKQRNIILAFSIAALIIGVGAGVRLAQIENEREIRITVNPQPVYQIPEKKPPQLSENFYKPASTTAAQKPIKKAPMPPKPSDGVSAEAYIVGNLDTGDVLLERNADAVLPFASMSKLITALVATNVYSDPDQKLTIASTTVPVDVSGVKDGETFTVQEMLRIMLLTSSNRIAETLAVSAAPATRGDFVKLMSDYSWEIGMPKAFFADPSGLDKLNAGTARGFLAMAQYLYKSRGDILAITRTQSFSIGTSSDHAAHPVTNIHPFATDPRFIGGKTGHTPAALDTMVTILKLKDQPVAFIILRSQDRAKDTARLIEKVEPKL